MQRPVFIDLETRSACDLPEAGGWAYACHASTRLLTVAWSSEPGEYHVWMPGVLQDIPEGYRRLHLDGITVHTGENVPSVLVGLRSRPWCGHNSWTFDRQVWHECTDRLDPVRWLDSYPLALACGLPGGLNAIGQILWGEGKYESGSDAMRKASRATGEGDCEPENVPVGQQILVARYNVQDVKLLEALWGVIERECVLSPEERRVLAAHDAVNSRGARVDRGLVEALIGLSDRAKAHAVRQIAALTDGFLPDTAAIQSRTRVFQYLDRMGVSVGTSLRKDVVARFIDDNRSETDPDEPADEPSDAADCPESSNLGTVVKVLELRMQALRITGGKLDRALQSIEADGRARGLFAYWAAGTGRWGGRRIQVQNLPRPKPGVDCWKMIALYERTGRLEYDSVAALMPLGNPLYPFLSVDDAASALLRSVFVPDAGHTLAAADLSQIEARVLAWLAGERWLLRAFWDGSDPYIRMGEALLGPKEGWPQYPDPEKPGKNLSFKKHPYRQIVGKIPELACGYSMGPDKLRLYAAAMGYDLAAYGVSAQDAITTYRRTHPAIAGTEAGEYNGRPYFRGGIWDQMNEAALLACDHGGPVPVAGRVDFVRVGGHLAMVLPSGRRILYRNARVETVTPSYAAGTDKTVQCVTYQHPRYGRKRTYGGLWVENAVQAIARDVHAYGLTECESAGLPVSLLVHDELVASIDPGRFDDFMRLVSTPPPWLPDFPLDAEGGMASRYAKSPEPEQDDVVYRNGRPK